MKTIAGVTGVPSSRPATAAYVRSASASVARAQST